MERQEESLQVLTPAGTSELMVESLALLELAGYELVTRTNPVQMEPPTEQAFPGLASVLYVEFASTLPGMTREQLEKGFCQALDRALKIRAN